ncbi:MAG TPA: hypothetical protein VIT41_05925 [Microlunatus sp.]
MVLSATDHPDADRLYEIGLDGDVCDEVRRIDPTARVAKVGTSTILWSRLRRPDDLDLLLIALADFGLTPHEVHESLREIHPEQPSRPGRTGSRTARLPYCEVRIGGRLGAAALHHLGWSHRVVQTTVVTVRASHLRLQTVLAQLSSVTGVDYVVALHVLRPEPI